MRGQTHVVLFIPACVSGRSYLAKGESSDSLYVVYCRLFSRRGYLHVKCQRSNTRSVVYDACLSGRSYLAKSDRSKTRHIVYSRLSEWTLLWLKFRN